MPFQIIRNDITKVKADVIVNNANPKPMYGNGVDQAIYKAAGEKELLAERKKIGEIFDADSYELTGKIFHDIETYVDDNYVERSEYEYYGLEERLAEERDARFRRRKLIERERTISRQSRRNNNDDELVLCEMAMPSIEDIEISDADKTFQEKLFEYIDQTGMTDSEFYNPILIKRQMFYKIRKNKFYQPSRTNAIIFCIRLKLDIEQTNDLLSRAGFAFNPTNMSDMIIKACIINKQYDFDQIELYLHKKGCPELLKYE